MIAYLDSSVVLRIVLREPRPLREWRRIRTAVASALVGVECVRTLDRLRLRHRLDDAAVALRREAVFRVLEGAEIVEPAGAVLARASLPFPTALGTLDAIHLATAMLWRERGSESLVVATHDEELATAARAVGLGVVGFP